MKSVLLLIGLLMLSSAKQVMAQEDQERKLIHALRTFSNTSRSDDSVHYDAHLNRLVFELTQTLQHDDITKFEHFKQVADSLSIWYEMKQSESPEYSFFTFQYSIESLNYVLKNREIVFKQEHVYSHFHEVHALKPNEFLVITLRNDMSYSCYEAYVINNLDRINGTRCLSVCSWTNVEESYFVSDPFTGELSFTGEVVQYDPIPILYDHQTKTISYRYSQQKSGEIGGEFMRSAKYKRGKFVIESYDVRDELD